ncbi:MAG: hypothetical protein C0393_02425 [Anaerolinea sp.]|nr:hypothetical protein [Anaerolinea sp.]
MYLCYVDESGTSDIPGNTSHFVLAGISIPIWHWKDCDREIETIKRKYALENSEIHVAWILRPYLEQSRISDFERLDYRQRRAQVESLRKVELLRLQRVGNPPLYKQTRKNYQKTAEFIHLSYNERRKLILEVADCISKWGFARLFAECVDKIHFDPSRTLQIVDEQSFEQIVSRFEQYLQKICKTGQQCFGILIHDNNETVAKKYTEMMKRFHQKGTLWTKVKNIIETPLFVDSQLTSMVQIADVCGYALRRYLENDEEELFNLVFQRADRKDITVVGVRHFTKSDCTCKICSSHRKMANP